MSVHSLPRKRPSNDGDLAVPPSPALSVRRCQPRARVLIRHSWVRAIDERTAPDRPITQTIVARGETRLRAA
jgi:hypothetical protein